jgi:hypothetical protein
MLPNHSPLVIAEQFGTLESLFPGRIDLGLGRAPGTDQRTLRALRRSPMDAESFPQDVLELQAYFGELQPGQVVQAVPGTGLKVPLWILGSSLFGAQLAAALGLPYAFASHFAPADLTPALAIYRENFRPSAQLDKPYAMVGANVIVADSDAEAKRLFTSPQQAFTNLLRGTRGQLLPPIDDIERYWAPHEKAQAQRMLECSPSARPTPCAPASAGSLRTRVRTRDRRGRDLRARRAAAFVRAAGRGVRFGSALARVRRGAKMANDFRARLKSGDTLLGTMVTLPSPPAAEVLASLGFDWLFIDAEHGPLETSESCSGYSWP